MTSMSASSCKFSISFPANYLFLLLQAKLGEGLSLQASLGNYGYVGIISMLLIIHPTAVLFAVSSNFTSAIIESRQTQKF